MAYTSTMYGQNKHKEVKNLRWDDTIRTALTITY